MTRTVNRKVIDEWVLENYPGGVGKLSDASGLSSSMISKIRVGRVPVRPITRRLLAQALNVQEAVLFPEMRSNKKSQAS